MEKRAVGSMGTWCLRQTLILLFSFRFLSSHIHLSSAVTDFIWIADTVMKTDLNLLNTFKREFVVFLPVDPGGLYGIEVHMFLRDFSHMFPAFFACVRSMLPLQGSLEIPTFSKTERVYFFYRREQIKEASGANLFN